MQMLRVAIGSKKILLRLELLCGLKRYSAVFVGRVKKKKNIPAHALCNHGDAYTNALMLTVPLVPASSETVRWAHPQCAIFQKLLS